MHRRSDTSGPKEARPRRQRPTGAASGGTEEAPGSPMNTRSASASQRSSSGVSDAAAGTDDTASSGGGSRRKFRGVYPSGSKWSAQITHEGKVHRLGKFDAPEAAARAYDAEAIRLLGSTAAAKKVNFPVSEYAGLASSGHQPLPPLQEEAEDQDEDQPAAGAAHRAPQRRAASGGGGKSTLADDEGSDSDSGSGSADSDWDNDALIMSLASSMRLHLACGSDAAGLDGPASAPQDSAAAAAQRRARGGAGGQRRAGVLHLDPIAGLPAAAASTEAAMAPAMPPVADGAAAGQLLFPPRSRKAEMRAKHRESNKSAGPGWFGLQAPEMTPDLKRDLRLLKLRGAFDPKRFYKTNDTSKLPTHFAIGTVVEGAADFFSGRLTKRERKGTFAEEIMGDEGIKSYRKRRFDSIQDAAQLARRKRQKGKKSVPQANRERHVTRKAKV